MTAWSWVLMILSVVVAAGCRTATRVVDVPRVDLEDTGGNRGYLLGPPPPATAPAKRTRQMLETEMEFPFSLPAGPRSTRSPGRPVGLQDVAPPEVDLGEQASMSGPMDRRHASPTAALEEMTGSYTVRTGETLWSIAAQEEVFGDATKWRTLYEANRDVLPSPDRLHAGMVLRIPQASSAQSPAWEDEDMSMEK